jgi:hypothetical protein
VVFCGHGETGDFEDRDLSGQWALCLDEDKSWMKRLRGAREAGALGLIVTPGPDYSADPYPERFADQVERARNSQVRYPDGERESDPVFPQVFLSPEAGRQLMGGAGASLKSGDLLPGVQFAERRVGAGEIRVENVCGFWPGDDPQLARDVIIVSAHYDHVGTDTKGVVYNGADDNGSGTTGLLNLAEALAAHGPMRRSVMLMWVSGEEKGLWGSRAWTENPWLPEGTRAVCDLNIDMIGRNAPEYLLITPTKARREYNGLVKLAEANAAAEGFAPLGSADEYWSRSDHANFAKNLNIPVAFLFSDVHEDYHRPTDDPDKIDCDKIRRVTRLVLRMLDGLQTDTLDL